MKYLGLLFLLWSQNLIFCQSSINFNQYVPLECKGDIPKDLIFNDFNSNKVTETQKNLAKLENNVNEFSNYELQNLLYSGSLLFGDILSQHVNKVADSALKGEPELRSKLRFYVIQKSDVNAFCLNMGVVFITTGLLSQIENDAQLAFIICHEAVHFKFNHILEKNKHRANLKKSEIKNLDPYQRLKILMSYSKEIEFEADREGLKLYQKSPFRIKNIESTFDMLNYSNLPYSQNEFDTLYFNTENYKLPQTYFLKKLNPIKINKIDLSGLNSHPDAFARYEKISRIIENEQQVLKGYIFVDGVEKFRLMQKVARFELVNILNVEGKFYESFYTIYNIENEYEESEYINKLKVSLLYKLSKIKNYQFKYRTEQREKVIKDKEFFQLRDIEGNIHRVYYFFISISAKELNVLALNQLFKYQEKYDQIFFEKRIEDLTKELIEIHDLKKHVFFTPTYNNSSKVDIINQEIYKTKVEYFKNAFSDINDDYIKKTFNKQEDLIDSLKKVITQPNYIKFKIESDKITEKYGHCIGINSIEIINPNFFSFKLKTIKIKYIPESYLIRNEEISPNKELEIEQYYNLFLIQQSNDLNLKINTIGRNNSSTINTSIFNDMQNRIRWVREKNAMQNVESYAFNHQFVDTINNKNLNTSFFQVLNLGHAFYIEFSVYDILTDEQVYVYESNVQKSTYDNVKVRAMIYEMLDHLVQKPFKIKELKVKYEIK